VAWGPATINTVCHDGGWDVEALTLDPGTDGESTITTSWRQHSKISDPPWQIETTGVER
jgi:hypothetical protein